MFHFYSIFDHLYCSILYYYFIFFITIVYWYICILYRTICIYKFYIIISSFFISIVYCCIFILYSTICIYRIYITILSVFVSIVHGVCLYSIPGPFLFYALKLFILCNLFIYFVTSDTIGLEKSVTFPALIGSPHTAARRIRKLR